MNRVQDALRPQYDRRPSPGLSPGRSPAIWLGDGLRFSSPSSRCMRSGHHESEDNRRVDVGHDAQGDLRLLSAPPENALSRSSMPPPPARLKNDRAPRLVPHEYTGIDHRISPRRAAACGRQVDQAVFSVSVIFRVFCCRRPATWVAILDAPHCLRRLNLGLRRLGEMPPAP